MFKGNAVSVLPQILSVHKKSLRFFERNTSVLALLVVSVKFSACLRRWTTVKSNCCPLMSCLHRTDNIICQQSETTWVKLPCLRTCTLSPTKPCLAIWHRPQYHHTCLWSQFYMHGVANIFWFTRNCITQPFHGPGATTM